MTGVMPRSFLVKTAREESLRFTERSGAQLEIAALIGRTLHDGIEGGGPDLPAKPATGTNESEFYATYRKLGKCNSSNSVTELGDLYKHYSNNENDASCISDGQLEMMTTEAMSNSAGHSMDLHVASTIDQRGKDMLSLAINQRYNGLKIPLHVPTNDYLEYSHTKKKSNRDIAREIVDLQTNRFGAYKKDKRLMDDVRASPLEREGSPVAANGRTDINGNKVERRCERTSQSDVDDEGDDSAEGNINEIKTDAVVKVEYITDDEGDAITRSPGRDRADMDKPELLSDRRKLADDGRPLVNTEPPKSLEYNPWSNSLYPGIPPSYPYYPYCLPGLPFPILPEHFPFRHSTEQAAHATHRALYPTLPFPPNIPPYGLPPRSDKLFSLENRKDISQFNSAFDPVKLAHEHSPPPAKRRLDRSESEIQTLSEDKKDPDPSKYQCSGCQKGYSTFSGLSKHQQFHCCSDVKKEFNCKYCEKTYVSLGALKMHIRTHTLPCKCKLCGKAFSRPWLLQGHVRTHTGEKPFSCNQCARAFADRSNLRAHLQTHSDVKKYSCKRCSKTFSRMSLLLKHEDSCGFGYSA